MTDSKVSTFPLADATAISVAPASDIPKHIDLIYTLCVDIPGFGQSQLGPVAAWETATPGLWSISIPQGLSAMSDKHKERLLAMTEESIYQSGDIASMMFTGMVKKNDFSWDALCTAHRASDAWKDNITSFLIDSFNNSAVVWWMSYPAIDNQENRALLALLKVDSARREELSDVVHNYMYARSNLEEASHLSHNSSVHRLAQANKDSATEELFAALGDDIRLADDAVYTSDNGETFLK